MDRPVGTLRDTVSGDGGACDWAGLGRADGESANLHWHPLVAPAGPGTSGGQPHNPSPAAMSQNTGGTLMIRLRALAGRRFTTQEDCIDDER